MTKFKPRKYKMKSELYKPDYMEVAYKEAVDRLKFFLQGAYTSPALGSFQGSMSIRNLDDTDIESRVLQAPSRFRPRLTAKYATLYADSLKRDVSPSSAAPQIKREVASAASPEIIQFIKKQEEYIDQLERESHYCKEELSSLLGKVKEVIHENESLQSYHHKSRQQQAFPSDSEDSFGRDHDCKSLIPSKKKRELRSYSATRLEGPNIVFESRIAELEAQLTQAKIELKKSQDENNENRLKLARGYGDIQATDSFKRQIDFLQRDKTNLEGQIARLRASLNDSNKPVDRSLWEASEVEKQLRDEKNQLESEIRRLKDELSSERSKLRDLAGEGARRALQERGDAEKRYSVHLDQLAHDLTAQYDNVARLQMELERQRRDESELRRELSMKNAAVEELKMEIKNKVASLTADMNAVRAEKSSLEDELSSARLALERQQRQAKNEQNRAHSEIQSLRQRLDRADADLVHSRRENLRQAEQIAALEKELQMRNLTPASPSKAEKGPRSLNELETMVQTQNKLMDSLTGECRALTSRLDEAGRKHKQSSPQKRRKILKFGETKSPPGAFMRPKKRVREEITTLQRSIDHLSEQLMYYQTSPAQPTYTSNENTEHTRDSSGYDNGVPITPRFSRQSDIDRYRRPGDRESFQVETTDHALEDRQILSETDAVDDVSEPNKDVKSIVSESFIRHSENVDQEPTTVTKHIKKSADKCFDKESKNDANNGAFYFNKEHGIDNTNVQYNTENVNYEIESCDVQPNDNSFCPPDNTQLYSGEQTYDPDVSYTQNANYDPSMENYDPNNHENQGFVDGYATYNAEASAYDANYGLSQTQNATYDGSEVNFAGSNSNYDGSNFQYDSSNQNYDSLHANYAAIEQNYDESNTNYENNYHNYDVSQAESAVYDESGKLYERENPNGVYGISDQGYEGNNSENVDIAYSAGYNIEPLDASRTVGYGSSNDNPLSEEPLIQSAQSYEAQSIAIPEQTAPVVQINPTEKQETNAKPNNTRMPDAALPIREQKVSVEKNIKKKDDKPRIKPKTTK